MRNAPDLFHEPVSRRRFVRGMAAAGGVAAFPFPFQSVLGAGRSAAPVLSGRDFALEIGPVTVHSTRRCAIGLDKALR
jgi:hypothetical protein